MAKPTVKPNPKKQLKHANAIDANAMDANAMDADVNPQSCSYYCIVSSKHLYIILLYINTIQIQPQSQPQPTTINATNVPVPDLRCFSNCVHVLRAANVPSSESKRRVCSVAGICVRVCATAIGLPD